MENVKNLDGVRNLLFDLGGVIMNLRRENCVEALEQLGLKDADEMLGLYCQTGPFMQLEEGKITVKAELSTAYYEKPNDASLWGLLINAGMVTIEERKSEEDFTVRVPNQEVWKAFRELTAFYLRVEEGHIGTMLYDLEAGKMDRFAEDYQGILMKLPSYHDLKSENSYHMMMLGMCAFMQRHYEVSSNRENGGGRGDIVLRGRKPQYPGMILEFKYTKDESQDLEELALEAISQIKGKGYDAGMDGIVYFIGLAHCGKRAEVRWEKKQS